MSILSRVVLGVSVVLLIGATVAVAVVTRREPQHARRTVPTVADAPRGEAGRPLLAETSAPSPAPAAQPAPAASAVAGSFPTDPAALVRALEPMVRETSTGLQDLDVRGGCRPGDAYVVVTLESTDGAVWVRDAEVKPVEHEVVSNPGDTGREYVPGHVDGPGARCMVGAFKGKKIVVPSALPGRRWTMSYQPPRHG